MCKSMFTFDVLKVSLILVLVHGIVANRLSISGAIPVGDYLQRCCNDNKIKQCNGCSPNSALIPAGQPALQSLVLTNLTSCSVGAGTPFQGAAISQHFTDWKKVHYLQGQGSIMTRGS